VPAQRSEAGRWAAEDLTGGTFIGWLSLQPSDEGSTRELDLGYRLRRSAWGHGYATEGARALIHKAFTALGAQRVFAQTMAVNTRSRRVTEKSGLRHTRTFHLRWDDPIPGTEHGEVEYELLREDRLPPDDKARSRYQPLKWARESPNRAAGGGARHPFARLDPGVRSERGGTEANSGGRRAPYAPWSGGAAILNVEVPAGRLGGHRARGGPAPGPRPRRSAKSGEVRSVLSHQVHEVHEVHQAAPIRPKPVRVPGQAAGRPGGGSGGRAELCSIRVFCGDCSCGCPELFLDPGAEEPRRIVLADDFGQRVQMSVEQFEQLVRDAKSGALDSLIEHGPAT
jgi:hypothetical protein